MNVLQRSFTRHWHHLDVVLTLITFFAARSRLPNHLHSRIHAVFFCCAEGLRRGQTFANNEVRPNPTARVAFGGPPS